jgi:hypothetical protein
LKHRFLKDVMFQMITTQGSEALDFHNSRLPRRKTASY